MIQHACTWHFEQHRDDTQSFVLQGTVPGSPAARTQELLVGDKLVGVLGRRVDVLETDQLESLMSNLPKDHPIGMQFLRKGDGNSNF